MRLQIAASNNSNHEINGQSPLSFGKSLLFYFYFFHRLIVSQDTEMQFIYNNRMGQL